MLPVQGEGSTRSEDKSDAESDEVKLLSASKAKPIDLSRIPS